MRLGLNRHRDRQDRVAKILDVVGHPHAHLERIARRHHGRRIGRQHEIAAHGGAAHERAHGVAGYRHRHQPQLAVEVFWNDIAHFAIAIDVDQPRPVSNRRRALFAERIEMAAEQGIGVATRCRRGQQLRELGQDQIENLPRLHLQHALLQEVIERIAELVARHLQNALVHRKHRHPRRASGVQLHPQGIARLHQRRRVHLQRQLVRGATHRERHDGVAQRAHEDFRRARIAHVLHIHITIAGEIGRHPDVLHRAGAGGLEPLLRIHRVALDGDQPGAGIGRTHRNLDRLAGRVIVLVQGELQFGVALQRAADVGSAGHREQHAVEFLAGRVLHQQRVAARCIGRQRQIEASRRDGEHLIAQRHFLELALVLVHARILPRQDRGIAPLQQHQGEAVHRRLLGGGVDRNQSQHALGLATNGIEIAIGLDPDQIIARRHQAADFGADAAPAFGLETARHEQQAVAGVGVFAQIECELGVALIVGGLRTQRLAVTLLGALGIVELKVWIAAKCRKRRGQGQAGLDPSRGGRGTKQVLQIEACAQRRGLHPALAELGAQMRAGLHAVGQELLHLHRGGADALHLIAMAHQRQADRPHAGGRRLAGGVAQFLKTLLAQSHAAPIHAQATRIDDIHLQRHAFQRALPVQRAHDHADVEGVAGPVQTAIGKQPGTELAGHVGIANATDIEARGIELAVAAAQRQERQILALAHHQQRRRFFAIKSIQRSEMRVPLRIAGQREQTLAVLAENLDAGASHRLALFQRLHEHIQAAVHRLLQQHAQIGDHHQPGVLQVGAVIVVDVVIAVIAARGEIGRAEFLGCLGLPLCSLALPPFGLRIVVAQSQQEYATLAAIAQVTRQVDAFVMCLARLGVGKGEGLLETLADLIRRQAAQLRLGVAAVVECGQIRQLFGQHPADVQTQPRHIARHHRHALLALEAEQGAIGHEAQHARVVRHAHHKCRRLAQHETAERTQPAIHSHVQITPDIGLELVAVQGLVFELAGDRIEIELLGCRDHALTHLARAAGPVVRITALLLARTRAMQRQQPHRQFLVDVALGHRLRRRHHQHLLGFEAGVVDQRRLHAVDGQAVLAGHRHLARQ